MTDDKDQVGLSALLRSHPVRGTWVITFGWGRDWWFNQENGLCTDLESRPTGGDIERMLK